MAYTRPKTVTHPSTNRAQRALTSFMNRVNSRNDFGHDGKGQVFPYSLPSVGPGADPGVQAVSPQVT